MSSKIRQHAICLSKKHVLLVIILLGIVSFISLSSIALKTNKSLSSKAATNSTTTQQQTATCTKAQVLCGNKDQFACGEGNVYCCHAGLSLGADNKCSSSSNSSPPITSTPQPTITVSLAPTTPPETVSGDYCRNEGCACRNTQDCNGPNFCVYTGYVTNGGAEKICGTPQVKFYQQVNHFILTRDNFNSSTYNLLGVIHNVVDENNVEYMYSCNWKTDADYQKGSGTIRSNTFFNVVSQEHCQSNLGTNTFAIKINFGPPSKPVWAETKLKYSIIENDPKVCYLPEANELISFKPDSCLFVQGVYYLCTNESSYSKGSLKIYVAPPSMCKSFVNSYGCSIEINRSDKSDSPNHITLFRDECYEQNGQYQLCDYNFTTNKFELKVGEKTYCQYHLHK